MNIFYLFVLFMAVFAIASARTSGGRKFKLPKLSKPTGSQVSKGLDVFKTAADFGFNVADRVRADKAQGRGFGRAGGRGFGRGRGGGRGNRRG